MRMHDKEWYAVACRPQAAKQDPLAGLQRLAADLPVTWKQAEPFDNGIFAQLEVVSARRYFVITDVDATVEDYLQLHDTPRLIRRGQAIRFGYPGYTASMSVGGLRGTVVVLLPYAGLAREFWNDGISAQGSSKVAFTRVNVGKMLAAMQAHGSSTANLQLKLGRALVHNDPNARVVTVRGQNVLDSHVYHLLFGRQRSSTSLTFDDTYCRIAFYAADGRSMTVFLDRYGNLRARPGVHGSNLQRLCELLQQLAGMKLVDEITTAPTRRLYLEDEV
jgi:hypothetical protein